MRAGRSLRVGVLLACLGLLVACDYTANAKAQDLCTQYDQLVTSVNKLRSEDPLTAKAEELRTASQEVVAQLDEFQAVSDGRLDVALSTLRADVAAMKESAVVAGTEALDAARPQLQDAFTNLAEAWSVVERIAFAQCGPAS